MSDLDLLAEAAIRAVARAVDCCRSVAATELRPTSLNKEDRSPVTVADLAAQAVVSLTLQESCPDIPIVGEESSRILRAGQGKSLRHRVAAHVAEILYSGPAEPADESDWRETVLQAIDRCGDTGGGQGLRWVLDPIDGTKGFLRGEQYAVALALLENGMPVLGVLGCPNLPIAWSPAATPSDSPDSIGAIFFARRGRGVVQIADPAGHRQPHLARAPAEEPFGTMLSVATTDDPRLAVFCESVESGHSAHDRHQAIAKQLGVVAPAVRMDSQCKYAAVARGEAALYLRLPTSETYREKIWDHAAGWLVVTEAGGRVTDIDGVDLDFSTGRTFPRSRGVVASNGRLHNAVIDAIRQTAGAGTA